tara:strand:+ start:434 stop:724 length:291 start_codon:yes stop_codon:yes gene_type:complete
MYPQPNITRPYELFTHTNTITNGMFGPITLTGIFLVALLSMLSKTGDLPKSFAASSFITLVMCILLMTTGLIVQMSIFYMCVALALGGLAAVWIKQ